MPYSCMGPRVSVFRISMSSVPCTNSPAGGCTSENTHCGDTLSPTAAMTAFCCGREVVMIRVLNGFCARASIQFVESYHEEVKCSQVPSKPVKSFYTGQCSGEGLAAADGKQYSSFVRN